MTNSEKVNQMLEAAVHFGHRKEKWNPKMKKYLFGQRQGIHIFDLYKSADHFTEALNFIKKCAKEGKIILLVSTKQQAQKVLENTAKETGLPFISQRWIGGFLTNFDTIKKRIKYLNDLKEAEKRNEFEKYTKKEALKIKKEMVKLEGFLGGVASITKKPDVIFVLDVVRDKIAVKEARLMNIPIVAVVDSNADPEGIDYVIPGNDDAPKSIKYYMDAIKNAYLEGKGGKS